MNNPSWLTPPPEQPHTVAKAILVLIFIVVVILCVAAYVFFAKSGSNVNPLSLNSLGLSSHTVPVGQKVFVSPDSANGAVSEIVSGSSVAEPYTVPGLGISRIIDVDVDGTSTPHYLIEDPTGMASNVYAANATNPNAGLLQVTNTNTLKSYLSYDTFSGNAAYQVSGSSSETHVIVYNGNTKKETDVGVGSEPTLLPGGFFVIVRRGNQIDSINTVTGKVTILMYIQMNYLFAIDPSQTLMAVYYSKPKLLQYYSLKAPITARLISSTSFAPTPASLSYLNHVLYMTATSTVGTSSDKKPALTLEPVGSGVANTVTFSVKAPLPQDGFHLSASL